MFEGITGIPEAGYQFLGNDLMAYGEALLIGVGIFIIFKIFEKILLAKLKSVAKKTQTDLDDVMTNVLCSIHSSFYFFLALWIGAQFLTLHPFLNRALYALLILWAVYEAIGAMKVILNFILKRKEDGQGDEEERAIIGFIRQMLVGIMWVIGIMLVLSNLGVDITSLIAGLGIGGVAIALAVQNILGDLFSAFSIYFDKPFEVGDFIQVGELSGTVEKIGIKTTRLKSLTGEELVFSNEDLTSSRVHNYRRLESRRIAFKFGVTYDTDQKKLAQIPEFVRGIIEDIEQTEFERAHFIEFGDSALNYEVVYHVLSEDFDVYRDNHQKLLLGMNEKFAKEKIEFAFPTQTVRVVK